MLAAHPVVFLLDVDNTLLDNDRFGADLEARLQQTFGAAGRDRYLAIYDALRDKLGYADYLGALQQFRLGLEDCSDLLQMSSFMLEYPFAERLYPRALETIAHLRSLGTAAVLSDGDIVFQPRKIQRSGIWDAVGGQVRIELHKERTLDGTQHRFPASHYVMIDDKPQILASMKRVLGERLTTVFVRQGHYAADSAGKKIDPAPDVTIERIADMLDCELAHLSRAASSRVTVTNQE